MKMKAIQIKYLSATDKLGARLKVWTDAGSITEPRDYDLDLETAYLKLAKRYIASMGWDAVAVITGEGIIPSGDYVATIGRPR